MTQIIIYVALGILVTAAIVIFIVSRVNRSNQERVTGFKNLALSMVLTFSEKGDSAIAQTLAGFSLFSQGYSKKLTNLLAGSFNNIPVKIFDYQYVTGGGQSTHVWKQTVVIFESERLRLPKFSLRPETFFDKIGDVLGYKDIDFGTHPQFSKQYFLRGSDEELIRNLFSQQMLKYFEDNPGLSVEGDGAQFLKYRQSKIVAPENIPSLLQESYDLYVFFRASR